MRAEEPECPVIILHVCQVEHVGDDDAAFARKKMRRNRRFRGMVNDDDGKRKSRQQRGSHDRYCAFPGCFSSCKKF